MRTYHFLLPAVLCFTTEAHAQFFIEAHGSHLLPVGGYGMSSSTESGYSSQLVNFGRGSGGGIALGSSINSTFGWEARFTYMAGTEQKTTDVSSGYSSQRTSTDTWKTTYVRIEPALRISAGQGAVRGYLAVGPSIAVAPKLAYSATSSYSYSNEYSPQDSYTRSGSTAEDYKGGTGWGGFGALGITWSSGKAFGLFAEVQASALNWAPKESHYTDQETTTYANGQVVSVTEDQSIDYQNHVESGQQNASTKLQLPMSTWGVRAGIRFTLGSTKG